MKVLPKFKVTLQLLPPPQETNWATGNLILFHITLETELPVCIGDLIDKETEIVVTDHGIEFAGTVVSHDPGKSEVVATGFMWRTDKIYMADLLKRGWTPNRGYAHEHGIKIPT